MDEGEVTMKRFISLAALLAVTAIVVATGSSAASTLCVGGSGCYATLAAAVAAAQNGDTIRINPGTYAGGVTITTSVSLAGAGAQRTTIRGGGPVMTLGAFGSTTEPTVSIDGVTITGGTTTTSAQSRAWVGEDGVFAFGGGIEIPPNADYSGGATVTISNSVIAGNRATPTVALGCNDPCAHYASGGGGGVDSWGTLTLVGSAVRGNIAGSTSGTGVTSEAVGGAILSHLSSLTVQHSEISNNTASAIAPNGQFADGGGIMVQGGSLTVDASSVIGNRASLQTSYSGDIETNANAGGIHIDGDDDCGDPGNCASASITASVVSGNAASATNSAGDAVAFCGGICNDGVVGLARTTVSGNSVSAASSTAGASADSGGLGQGGPGMISDSTLTNNSVSALGSTGDSVAQAGGLSTGDQDVTTTISRTTISGNHVSAWSAAGNAVVFGGGMSNGGLLDVDASDVSHNIAQAKGPAGSAHGGGIWNSDFGGGAGSTMTLTNSTVRSNSLVAQKGLDSSGGGIFNTAAVVFGGDVIRSNSPDNCAGVSC